MAKILGTIGKAARGALESADEVASVSRAVPGDNAVLPASLNPLQDQTKFRESLETARSEMDPRSRMQVSPLPEDFDGKLFMSSDGMTGFAIDSNGELISAFNNPVNPRRGAMSSILTRARSEGATHLHGFENLADSYIKRGAVETERFPWDPKEAESLTEWDTGSMGTPDYVRMDIGSDPAPAPAAAPKKPRRKRSPVDNPQRQAYPGIHKDPREIAAEANARLAPEDPALQQLFGVSREDLYDLGRGRSGNIPGSFKMADRPTGSAAAQNVMTPRNKRRIVDILGEAEAYPGLIQGTDSFYVMDPAYHRLVELVGEEEAIKRYADLNAFTGMASPGSDVMTELNRGSAANWLHQQGRFDDFEQFGGVKAVNRGPDFPDDMRGIIAHPYHPTAHSQPMRKYVESGEVQMDSPKVPPYIQASGVPKTGFQTNTPVPDAHWSRGVGLADVRTGKRYNASATTPELQTLAPWYRDIADALGMQANPAQARQWGVMGPQTGVETPIGAPKLELMAGRIVRRADEVGISPQEMRDRVLRGEDHMGLAGGAVTAGAATAGVLATPESNEAMAGVGSRTVRQMVTQAKNAAGKFRRGGNDGATALNLIEDKIARVQGLRNISEAERTAAMDELWQEYAKVQAAAGEEGGRLMTRGQTDIPGEIPMLENISRGQLSPEEAASSGPFDNIFRADRPYTPEEAAGVTDFMRTDREMRQLPPQYYNPGLAQGQFVHDPFQSFSPQAGPGRQYTPDEIEAFNNPDREMYGVAGAAGMGMAISDDAQDPGSVMQDTVQDDNGRVSEVGLLDPLIEGIGSAATTLGGLPGFARGALQDFAGMAAGGLGAVNEMVGAIGSQELGEGAPPSIGQLAEGIQETRDRFGTVPEDNAVLQQLSSFFEENPRAVEALMWAMDGYEGGINKAYDIDERLGLFLESAPRTAAEFF